MTDTTGHDSHVAGQAVFSGLVPTRSLVTEYEDLPRTGTRERGRLAHGFFATVPIVVVGTMAISMNLTGAVQPANASPYKPIKPRSMTSELGTPIRGVLAATTTATRPAFTSESAISLVEAPDTYRVAAGDTVSSIAGRYGLSTASVLALNGLGWSSLIFPGQVLTLTTGALPATRVETRPVATPARYTIVTGDTVSAIAARFGTTTQTLLSANGLGWSSIIYPGQTLAIPGLAASSSVQPTTDPPASSSYRIVTGDTISSIAASLGIDMQVLLDANALSASSAIYAGHTLVVPGFVATASTSDAVAILSPSMMPFAQTIVGVGRSLGVPDQGIVIALAAAMQESTMRNLTWGDLDSVGLFQQRPSAGWGSVDQLTDPGYAAKLFYGGPSNPNAGNTRGLLDILGWQSITVTQAAQSVQLSAHPDAYAKWETSARAWLDQLG